MNTDDRTKQLEVSITEPLNLGKLRWLTEQCAGLPDDARVTVKEHRSLTPFDQDRASITVRGNVD